MPFYSARMEVQLLSMMTRFVSLLTRALAMPFSELSIIQIVSVPSAFRPAELIELALTDERVPLPYFGFSP